MQLGCPCKHYTCGYAAVIGRKRARQSGSVREINYLGLVAAATGGPPPPLCVSIPRSCPPPPPAPVCLVVSTPPAPAAPAFLAPCPYLTAGNSLSSIKFLRCGVAPEPIVEVLSVVFRVVIVEHYTGHHYSETATKLNPPHPQEVRRVSVSSRITITDCLSALCCRQSDERLRFPIP